MAKKSRKGKETNPKDALGIRKVSIHAVPMQVIAELGLAMMEGGRKYGTHNYRKAGVRASVYIDALFRHVFLQWWEGEDIDIDSNLNHITKAIATLVVLRDSMLMDNWIDDRPIRNPANSQLSKQFNELAGQIIDKYPDCPAPYINERKK